MTFVLLRGHSKHAKTASWKCQVGRNQLALLPEGTQRRLALSREAMHAVTAVLLVAAPLAPIGKLRAPRRSAAVR